MKNFKEFGITPPAQSLTGDKIKISKVLNKEITVHGHRLEDSKFNDGQCLYLEISLGENRHIIFTQSAFLIAAVLQVPAGGFPFTTTIVEENDRSLFT